MENILSRYQSTAQRTDLISVDDVVADINHVCSALDCIIDRVNENGCSSDVNISSLSFFVEQPVLLQIGVVIAVICCVLHCCCSRVLPHVTAYCIVVVMLFFHMLIHWVAYLQY